MVADVEVEVEDLEEAVVPEVFSTGTVPEVSVLSPALHAVVKSTMDRARDTRKNDLFISSILSRGDIDGGHGVVVGFEGIDRLRREYLIRKQFDPRDSPI